MQWLLDAIRPAVELIGNLVERAVGGHDGKLEMHHETLT